MAFITADARLLLQSMDRIDLLATVKSLTKRWEENKRNGFRISAKSDELMKYCSGLEAEN
jgi:hypothetical protein